MLNMGRWFGGTKDVQASMNAKDEEAHLRQVENALLLLLNDDITAAEKILMSADSSFHAIGRGISKFISSMLGAEKEFLRDAAAALQEAENKAWEDMKRSQRDATAFRSQIYSPGTEYLLCYTVSLLTSAICAVLSGSVVQAIGGFTKLRKAFLILDDIMVAEAAYIEKKLSCKNSSKSRSDISRSSPGATTKTEKTVLKSTSKSSKTGLNTAAELTNQRSSFQATDSNSKILDFDLEDAEITYYIDIFIHSGTRLCYGILLVVFSMIESPLFTKILYIVGFKGDRERGTLHLWQASRFDNFNSAIAGITILMYYSGIVGYCDILPTDEAADDDLSGYPKAKFKLLLSEMRNRYPESKLWKLEEARMFTYDRNLAAAVQILTENSNSNVKQIATISTFELSLSTMFHHDYDLMAKSWIQCAELSNWSPTLYAFLAGAAYLELYREHRLTNPTYAKELKDSATKYFRKGPPLSGKQKLMSKQLPFDMYIVRKCQKWEERAAEWGVDLIDAIGVSPLGEMIYLWGGTKKQNLDELQKSMNVLAWDRVEQQEKHKSDLDETATHALLKAAILRNMGKYKEARETLKVNILCHDKQAFRGHLKDDWTNPNAYYEMACLAWQEKDLTGQDHKTKILECKEWLEKVQNYSIPFVLDSRLSMKLTTSMATLKRHRRIMGI